MKKEWAINSTASDVIVKSRRSLIDYMPGDKNNFKGHIAIEDDELEDASIEFLLNVNHKDSKPEQKNSDIKLIDFFETDEAPVIQFKSTSFQKINKNINFLKGHLTIKNITKVVELEAEFNGINLFNGVRKASFEVIGNINRKDFGLNFNAFSNPRGLAPGSDIKLIANLEFTLN